MEEDARRRQVREEAARQEEARRLEAVESRGFDLIAARIPAIRAEYGAQAIALYLGNPNAHTVAGTLYAPALIRAGS